jgi:hypothetical protein
VTPSVVAVAAAAKFYDEWLQQQQKRQISAQQPDLIIAFNAGIWGYQDEWQPTIRFSVRRLWSDSNYREK